VIKVGDRARDGAGWISQFISLAVSETTGKHAGSEKMQPPARSTRRQNDHYDQVTIANSTAQPSPGEVLAAITAPVGADNAGALSPTEIQQLYKLATPASCKIRDPHHTQNS
jgi:hypothetical protein